MFENLGKNVQNLKICWKRTTSRVCLCDYRMHESARICPANCHHQRQHIVNDILEKSDPWPWTPASGTPGYGTRSLKMSGSDPGTKTSKVGSGNQDPKIFKWDSGHRTPKMRPRIRDNKIKTQDFQLSIKQSFILHLILHLLQNIAFWRIYRSSQQCVTNFKEL